MIRKMNNTAAAITLIAKVDAADMLRNFVQTAKAAHTASLALVCSAVGYLFLVNHFKDADADGYQNRGDATAYLKEQLAKQADVKGGMLDIYVSRADALYGKIKDSTKLFGATIKQISECEKPAEISELLTKWLNDNWKIKSLSELSSQLGYRTGRENQGGDRNLTPERAITRIDNVMKAVEKIAGAGKGKVKESEVAQHVVAAVKKPIVFVEEAIKRLTEESELKMAEDAIKTQRQLLKRLSSEAKAAVKAGGTAKEPTKTKAKQGEATLHA